MQKNENQQEADYVGRDLFGYEYNKKYPPNKELYGDGLGGYATPNQETFFYDFCILHYGVAFSYKGEDFEVEFAEKGPIMRNVTSKTKVGPFDDAVALLENAQLGDKYLIELLEDLDYVVIH